ncbi:WD40-repeat-containing domain protein [Gaertneriomyces semiglobifer]|nr:WD40-repeat-containing domain protein [Gaertneriomyces semiglobifer]
MKLKIHQTALNKHHDIVTTVGWSGNNELYSFGDDNQILRWSSDGECLGQVSTSIYDKGTPDMPISITEISWFPIAPGKTMYSAAADVFAAAATDGKFYICTKTGRVEKGVEAHKGAVLCLRWNYEGSTLLTAGEDGQAKLWSRSGMLRSSLVQSGFPIYSISWSPENDQILYTSGKNLVIKSLQPSNKPTQWKAHDGLVLKVDWSLVNGQILSAGEDKKYKVWDSFGRQLFSSGIQQHPITAVAWNPSGDMFAVGSYDYLRLCDALGWSHALEKPESGSILHIAWTPDGTQMACAGGVGTVVFGHIVERRYEWKNYEVTILDDNKIYVHDVVQDSTENLDFRDRVIKVSFAFGYLIVATSSQCHIFNEKNWNTPAIVDLSNNGRVTCIQQSSENFVLVDTVMGLGVYKYDGRLLSQPKCPGLRAEFVTPFNISICADMLAIKDKADSKAIYVCDTNTGRQFGEEPVKHHTEIMEIGLNQTQSVAGRQLVLVDRNRDMFITNIMRPHLKKLGTMVETFAWNADSDILVAMMDYKFVIWYYPNVVFIDEDIAPLTKVEKDAVLVGKSAQIVNFSGTQCILRRADGAVVAAGNLTPLPALLQEFAQKKRWEAAIRLCRYVNMKELWACLAAMAVHGQDLNTAEVAYAAIDEIAKVEYITYIRDMPSMEAQAAELALLRRQPQEAESILIAANLIFKAIRMWISLFNWDRALELAVKYKTHVDTVLYFRARYLKSLGKLETNRKFIQYAQSVPVDAEKVKAKLTVEEERERTVAR